MPRRLLIITKDPEFDGRGEVVLGQCEPFTSGWKLYLFHNSQRELLLSGTYTDLRKIQETCASLEEPAAVRKRIQDMRALLTAGVTETVAVEFDDPKRSGRTSTRIVDAVMPTQVQMEPGSGAAGPYFELRREDSAVIALISDPDRMSDLPAFNAELRTLLAARPRAIVLDFSRVQNLASRAVNELALFRDECQNGQVGFALCGIRKPVLKLFDTMGQEHAFQIFDNADAALSGVAARK